MRFMHTADWHIGKKLGEFDLLANQQAIFEQLVAVAQAEDVDAIVIAGDIYDRALANEETVHTVDKMLYRLNRERDYPLLVISGNHDSAVRLRTGREWFASTQFYLNTQLAEAFTPIEMGNTQFFLLPYFEPFAVRDYFEDPEITNVSKAIVPIIARMQQAFDPDKQHVLVSHFFAAGSSHSDSETLVSVGGLDAVPTDVLAPFDYVALGHLHNRHALNNEAKIHYSGALLKYAVSEASQDKGVYIVDTDTMTRHFVALTPEHDLQSLEKSFTTLTDPAYYQKLADRDAYLGITLTDTQVIPNVMQQLRAIYPHIVSLRRKNGVSAVQPLEKRRRHLDPMALLDDFYTDMTTAPLSDDQRKWAKQALADVKGELS